MDVVVKGRHLDITPGLRQYAEEKVSRLSRYMNLPNAEVELTFEKNPRIAENQTAEVTIYTTGPVIRGKESSTDMHAAIDLVVEKIERQLKKFKGKTFVSLNNRAHLESTADAPGPPPPTEEELEEAEQPAIVKTKQFAVKPMTPEEAAMQMELIGHDFFVFTNSETEDINVVYKRDDGDYGLIEPAAG
ncbi:MAG: ribosome-associated translation inhibitor RaiA [Actinobacteria bacterium]|nr:MAG: ribosome-associated translation inhibitor RaiA [Actinomycetota bacterium]